MNLATLNSSKMPSTEASEVVVSMGIHRALVWALGAYLPPDDAVRAAHLWQPSANQQASATAGLSRYCRTVAKHFALQGREAELHLRIIRAMQVTGQGGVLPHEPLPASASTSAPAGAADAVGGLPNTSANDSVPPDLPAMAVQRFLQAVEQAAARECPDGYSPQLWRQSLLKHAQRIPQPLLVYAADWLWGRTVSLHGDWPARGAGTRLINTAYVTLAEWLGPVKADAHFTAIVREFENSQDPVLASVRRYL